MTRRVLANVGRCIYCGSPDDLSEEHIIPFGLQGDFILANASCKHCAKITSAVEQDILRNAWLAARAAIGLRTRRKNKRPLQFPLILERADGSEEERLVALEQHLTGFSFMIFPLPTSLGGPRSSGAIEWFGDMKVIFFGAKPDELQRKHPQARRIGAEVSFEPVNFARMIGKIGYGFAVAGLGLERVYPASIIPAILTGDDIGRWVGGSPNNRTSTLHEPGLHKVILESAAGEARVYIKLFAQFDAPEYVVCVRLLG